MRPFPARSERDPGSLAAGGPWSADGFRPGNLDLALAVLVALGVPVAAAWLLDLTGGAAASLALYYGVACLAIPRWRRGGLSYRWPVAWPWAVFLPSLLLPVALALTQGDFPGTPATTAGIALTALVWAPLNAFCEQVGWFYALDAWRLRWRNGAMRWAGLAVGVALLLAFTGAIHALFWSRVLPVAEGGQPLGRIGLNLLTTGAFWLLWRRAGSLWPVFALHLLVDLQLVLGARYAILPFL